MKKTNILLTSVAAVMGLAACGVPSASSTSSSAPKGINGITAFCDLFETAKNYTVTLEGTVAKFTEDAIDLLNDYGDGDVSRSGYFTIAGKGVYNYEADETGKLVCGTLATVNDKINFDYLVTGASFLGTAGDGVWDDTDDKNTFTSDSAKLLALYCTFFGYDGYEEYAESVELKFDNYKDVKTATFTCAIDLSEYYGETYVLDLSLTLSDIGTTVIEGLDALKADPKVPASIGKEWSDEEKAGMMDACGEILPTLDLSYASRSSFSEEYSEFDIFDLGGCGYGAAFEAKLVQAGWTFREDLSESEDGASYNYYSKDIPVTETSSGGYYLVEVDDVSAEAYAASDEAYAALYPKGTFSVYAYRVDYISYDEFLDFMNTTTYIDDTKVPAPSFTATPSKIVLSDQSLIGAFYYGVESWYNISASFASYEEAETELLGWYNTVKEMEGWTSSETYVEEYNTYCLYYDFGGEYGEDVYLEIDIGLDEDMESGAFTIDILA